MYTNLIIKKKKCYLNGGAIRTKNHSGTVVRIERYILRTSQVNPNRSRIIASSGSLGIIAQRPMERFLLVVLIHGSANR